MTFEEILDQAIAMLQRRGRLTYGPLKQQFQLDDAALDDLKDELIYGQRLAVDEEGRVLVWTGGSAAVPPPATSAMQEQTRAPLGYTPKHLDDKILPTRSALEDKRKQVTVLFADSERRNGLLHKLQALEIIYEQGLSPEPAYIFKHAVIQDVAYNSLLIQRRKALHRSIGEAIEELYQDRVEEHCAELAHHFTQGEVWDKAFTYSQQAGERAMARPAHREAVRSFEQALGALQHLPETSNTREQAIDLRIALRSALWPLSDCRRILNLLREAENLAEGLDDPRRLALVLHFLADQFHFMGAYDLASAAAQRALTLATASGEVVRQAQANQRLVLVYQAQGDYRRTIDCLRQSLAVFDGAPRREHFGQVFLPAVLSRTQLAWCHAELGTFAEGRTLGEEGCRIAEEVAHPGSLMYAYQGIGLLALRQDDLPRALPLLERAMGLCQDADLPLFFPWIAAPLGTAYALAGRLDDAVPLLMRALEQATATATVLHQALCRLSLGEAHLLADRLEAAHTLAERALALARAHQERGYQACALQLLGEIATHGEPRQAEPGEEYYRQALALADELGMRPLLAHCHCGLGTLYAMTGQRQQAQAEWLAAMELYRAMDMTFWLPQAEAALAQTESPAAHIPTMLNMGVYNLLSRKSFHGA